MNQAHILIMHRHSEIRQLSTKAQSVHLSAVDVRESGAQLSQICVLALLWHGLRFQKLKLGQDRFERKIEIALLLCNFIEKRHHSKLLVTDTLHHGQKPACIVSGCAGG